MMRFGDSPHPTALLFSDAVSCFSFRGMVAEQKATITRVTPMKFLSLFLRDFRGFEEQQLFLHNRVTVLVGVNGSGKSAILDALAILLSWVVARVRNPGGSGRSLRELDIRNQASYAWVEGAASEPFGVGWHLVKFRRRNMRDSQPTDLARVSQYARTIRKEITETKEQCNIPLFAYYPVNRAVLDIPLRIRRAHEFKLTEAWDESLTSAANFRSFFEWFRNREDLENENRKYMDQLFKPEGWRFPDPQLQAVRQALEEFLPEFTNFSVRRNPPRMTVLKRNQEMRVDQLSDGEKCLIALVGDLARRLAIANPVRENPLEGDGIVLIDEIDLHLHPAWQRMVIPRLIETFPNLQFVVSTHSPQVIGEVEPHCLRLLQTDKENRITVVEPPQSWGLTSNDILDELMKPADTQATLTRNSEVEQQLDQLFRLIDDERFSEARKRIEEIQQQLNGDIPELVRARSLLDMMESELEE
jgi:predicted ATP-binding protein involved in virulence